MDKDGVEKSKYVNNQYLNKYFKETQDKDYYSLPPATSISITLDLHRNWKSFFNKVKKDRRARPPKYLDKNGNRKFNFLPYQFSVRDSEIIIMKTNLNWKFSLPKDVQNRTIKNIEFLPYHDYFIMSLKYEHNVETKLSKDFNKVAGIDLGLNNLVAMGIYNGKSYIVSGKGLKSKNSYFNRIIAGVQSTLKKNNGKYKSHRLNKLWKKRHNIMLNYIHHTTKFIVDVCLENDVKTVVVGHNKKQKQNSNLKNFAQVPIFSLIPILKYKLEDKGITLIETTEEYTSGTSFLDNEKPIKKNYKAERRVTRGLFESNEKCYINADVNSAFQIIKKVSNVDFSGLVSNGSLLDPVKIAF